MQVKTGALAPTIERDKSQGAAPVMWCVQPVVLRQRAFSERALFSRAWIRLGNAGSGL